MSTRNEAKGQSDMILLGKLDQPAVNFMPDGSDYLDYHHTENDSLDKVNKNVLKHNTAIFTLFALYVSDSEQDFRR